MPYPKISPVLNNCPFYVLTPELKEEIAKYAADDAHDNGHNAQYTLLKQHFGAHYGIDPLSWKDFSGILKNYNAFDVQILLGPVLRNFSKEMMEKGDQEELFIMALGNNKDSAEDYVKATTEINAGNGRYDSLNPDHLFKYAAAPLGLSVTYNKTGNPSQSFDADRPVAAVSIHHHGNIEGAQAGGHWERVQNRDDAVDYEKAVDTQLTPLLPLLGDNATLNSFGLDLLKKHVQLMHRHEKDNFDMTKSVEEMMLTSAQIQRYMWNINYLPKPLAVKLLGEPLTQETTNLIRDMVIGHIDREPIIQRYFEAPGGNKPHVAQDAREIITKLEQGIIIPKVFIPPVIIDEVVEDVVEEVRDHAPVELEVQPVVKKDEVIVDQVVHGPEPKKAKNNPKKRAIEDNPDAHVEVQVEQVVHKPEPKKGKATQPKKKVVVENPDAHVEVQVEQPQPKKGKDKPKKKAVLVNHEEVVEQVSGPIQQVEQVVHDDNVDKGIIKKAEPIIEDLEEDVIPDLDLFGPVHHEPHVDTDPVIELPKEIKPEPQKPVLPNIENQVYKQDLFKKHIDALEIQVKSLKERKDEAPGDSKLDAAYNKADGVHGTLKEAGRKYFAKEMSYADFKKCSDDVIKDAKPVLEEHRGGKAVLEVLTNIALFLVSLIRSAYNGKMTFFKLDTESVTKVNAVEDSVNKAAPGA